ncbi:hypothetical protein CDL15_Pgr012298 [Punica granatum]|uniref:Extensin-like n=1 Tax=Punica granatum TaxID=22663 RepID=A0A218WS80_PUNGR|nr:hypothetical protein CDL15_Pgr012298 [Punica granatum]
MQGRNPKVNAGPEADVRSKPNAVNAGSKPDAGPKPNEINEGPEPDAGLKPYAINAEPEPDVGSKPNAVNAGCSQLASHRYPIHQRLRMAEGDRVDISEEVNPPVLAHSQPPPMHAPTPPTPAGMLPAYSGAPPTHLPPPTSSEVPLPPALLTSSASDDQARITALEGTVNQMATNMAELLALLRGPNRASLSSTPPPGQGPTVDPTPWVSPTQAPKNMDAPAPPTLHTSTAHPFTSPFPPPPAPTAVPLPSTAFLTSDQFGSERKTSGTDPTGLFGLKRLQGGSGCCTELARVPPTPKGLLLVFVTSLWRAHD